MVHALEEIHRMLVPGGVLIDLHPLRVPTLVEVHRLGTILFAEPPPDHEDDWEDYRQAEIALSEVIDRELFVLEVYRDLEFLAHADSVAELEEGLEVVNAYSTSVPTPEAMERRLAFSARVDQVAGSAGTGVEVAYREPGRISRLRRLPR